MERDDGGRNSGSDHGKRGEADGTERQVDRMDKSGFRIGWLVLGNEVERPGGRTGLWSVQPCG